MGGIVEEAEPRIEADLISHGQIPATVDGSSWADGLPEELLRDIFCRLPVESMGISKCVCKSWLYLIQSPEFVLYHHANSSNLRGDASGGFMVVQNKLGRLSHSISFLSLDALQFDTNCDSFSPQLFECKLFSEYEDSYLPFYCDILGPCNGIFCLIFYSLSVLALLWNPATKETRAITDFSETYGKFGFGFDSRTCDYKVVRTFSRPVEKDVHLVELYSLNLDSLRTIDVSYFFYGSKELCFDGCMRYCRCSCNGRMFNWICYDVCSTHKCLVTFDMSDEVFIPSPLPGTYDDYHFTSPQPNESQVSVFGYTWRIFDELRIVDFWVLDSDYGSAASWTILRSVELSDFYISRYMGMWKDKLLLFAKDFRLFFYDPASHNIMLTRVVKDCRLILYDPASHNNRFTSVEGNFHTGISYTPSLVSVKRSVGNQQGVQLSSTAGCDRIEHPYSNKSYDQDQGPTYEFYIELRR